MSTNRPTDSSDDGFRSARPRPSRLVDVAELAGVSRATAARALGGYGKVSAESLARVSEAAATLEYRTNQLARAIRAGRSKTIGLVIADISNSFFDQAARAIIDRAARSGYQVLVAHTDDILDAEVSAVHVLTDKRVDGLIVASSSSNEYSHLASNAVRHIPLVLVDRRIPDLHVATVTTNDYASSREVVQLFAERGHRRMGILVSSTGPVVLEREHATVSSVHDRVSGFLDQMSTYGLTMEADWLRYSRSDHVEATAVAHAMLSGANRPTAVMATNATMALGLIDACRQLSLAVGRDVSLVTFDDSEWARVFQPPISVIERPVHALGETAVELLLEQLESGRRLSNCPELDNCLVDRESVAMISHPVKALNIHERLERHGPLEAGAARSPRVGRSPVPG
ncbi:MAG: LacI family transcriptional regulator [Acidimicrobiaceae bacterium]|nr:LacI family transcriptional regulator [Acidimicrobiaceae bacterium]